MAFALSLLVHTTFFHKLFLTILAGFGAACLYYLFVHTFNTFNDSVNKDWNKSGSVVRPK